MAGTPAFRPLSSRRGILIGAAASLSLPARAQPTILRIGGTGAAIGSMALLGQEPRLAAAGLTIQLVYNLGSTGSIRAVQAGAIDVAIAARPISPAERATGLSDRSLGRTPLVLATHVDNPIEDLTMESAIGMIGGTIATWPNGMPVRVSRRPSDDGDTAILSDLSPAMADAVVKLQRRPGLTTASSDHDQAAALEAGKGSFGVLALSLIRSERRSLRTPRLDGVAPDAANWPMMKYLHVVVRGAASDSVAAFLTFLQSDTAVALMKSVGCLPIQAV